MRRPLLIVDGDSFAHRAYHALPNSIRRRGNKGAGAILGFANFLLRFYETEQPRAVLVGWDTLDAYRHTALPAYQSGREFDDELVEQLDVLPEFVRACGFAVAKGAGYEADDFLAAAVARESAAAGLALSPAEIATRFSWPRTAQPLFSLYGPASLFASDRSRSKNGTALIRRKYRTSSRCAAMRPIASPVLPA